MNYLRIVIVKIVLLLPVFTCGQTNPSIVGGSYIDIKEVPYQISMKVDGVHHCGGTILSDRWILTAAHCLKYYTPIINATRITIHAGTTNQTDTTQGQIIQAQTVFIHPLFNDSISLEHDIALIYLTQPLTFNNSVRPIEYATACNTDSTDFHIGNRAYLSGWGYPCRHCNIASPNLKGASLPLIHRDTALAINIAVHSGFTTPITYATIL